MIDGWPSCNLSLLLHAHTRSHQPTLSLFLSLSLYVSLCVSVSPLCCNHDQAVSQSQSVLVQLLWLEVSLFHFLSLSLSPSLSLSILHSLSLALSLFLTLFGYGRPLHHTTSPHSGGIQQWLIIELLERVLRNNCSLKYRVIYRTKSK